MRNRIFVALLAFVFPVMVPICYAQQKILASEDLAGSAKEFIELLAREDFSSAVGKFDSAVKKAMPAEKLREAWKSLIAQTGPFKRQVGIRTERIEQLQCDFVFVTCEFATTNLDIQIIFNGAKQITGLFFVPSQPPADNKLPSYIKTGSFREKEVSVGTGQWALPGTLTFPREGGPFPAVVLVHGSGPQDRDETIGPNKPFRDLAWGLASCGIAVLRYEKRTKAYAEKLASAENSITVKEETIEDALAAVSLLRKTEGIDAKKIFVLGHSLGGMLVPRIGASDPDIAGFIIMAGTTKHLEDVIIEQGFYAALLDGAISEDEKAQLEQLKTQAAKVKDRQLSSMTSSRDLLGAPANYWLDLRGYNPAEAARNLKQPMLILQGERDWQVTMEDFQGWKKSLSSRKDVEFKTYPKLNHLFIEGEGKSWLGEYARAGHVSAVVIDDIANWIKK